jgi:hypothetical protein
MDGCRSIRKIFTSRIVVLRTWGAAARIIEKRERARERGRAGVGKDTSRKPLSTRAANRKGTAHDTHAQASPQVQCFQSVHLSKARLGKKLGGG